MDLNPAYQEAFLDELEKIAEEKYHKVGLIPSWRGATKANFRNKEEAAEAITKNMSGQMRGAVLGGATGAVIGVMPAIAVKILNAIKKKKVDIKDMARIGAIIGGGLGALGGQDVGGEFASIKHYKTRGIKKTPFLPIYKFSDKALKRYDLKKVK
jgi:hypothetical protein